MARNVDLPLERSRQVEKAAAVVNQFEEIVASLEDGVAGAGLLGEQRSAIAAELTKAVATTDLAAWVAAHAKALDPGDPTR